MPRFSQRSERDALREWREDYSVMCAERECEERRDEACLADRERNSGLEGELYAPEPYYAEDWQAPRKPPCRCALCAGEAAIPASGKAAAC